MRKFFATLALLGFVSTANADGAIHLTTNQVPVGASATLITPARGSRNAVTIVNVGAATTYLGKDSNVTSLTGMPLAVGNAITLQYNGDVYGIGATTVGYAETW